METINLIAGVLLILFGLRFLRKGFARVMGGDLIDWLQDFTRTRPRAWIGGVAGGVVMPSSTAAALLSVQMTRRGNVAWENVLAVLLGAQLGTTALIQVLSFDLQAFAGLFIAVGAALFLYVEAPRPRGIGQALLAFGFMLLGMGLLGAAARELGSDPAVINLFAALEQLPLLFLNGVLCAPTAFGKTVTAAAIIARRGVNTLVLVHRTELLKQWQVRLAAFLDVGKEVIGIIGGGKNKPTGLIDIAVMQSLLRQGEVDPLVESYGQVIVDECHHVGAASFDAILRRAKAKHVIGLTATPIRRDGQTFASSTS